ncbi:hypothetical protein PCANC_19602 [Puccinia coronata f. sp. avenae]|uniref:Uncharacterized protein n=1 Tax=Puccinia coronata f. sp. avenae TaxID=200324 RepID=A0A2N5SP42_9BASI|nr:hypothetical protein PCANC_19602 [Puccinia coronata f. sp. avenae]
MLLSLQKTLRKANSLSLTLSPSLHTTKKYFPPNRRTTDRSTERLTLTLTPSLSPSPNLTPSPTFPLAKEAQRIIHSPQASHKLIPITSHRHSALSSSLVSINNHSAIPNRTDSSSSSPHPHSSSINYHQRIHLTPILIHHLYNNCTHLTIQSPIWLDNLGYVLILIFFVACFTPTIDHSNYLETIP